MLYEIHHEGRAQTFADADASRAWRDTEDSVYVAIDDRGLLYEQYYEAELGYYAYTLHTTDIMAPTALAILKQHAGAGRLSLAAWHTLALCLSWYSPPAGRIS
jgi:hypothetical protein